MIRHTMNGEIPQAEIENGIIYREAGNEECHQYILAAYEAPRRK